MVYTIMTRRRDGYINQKVFVECEESSKAVDAGRIMMMCDKSDYTEIYLDRVPKGDLWGSPVIKFKLTDGLVDITKNDC
jgi:hypothetical protein